MINFQTYASGSSGNLYTVDDGNAKVLIEMGLSIKQVKKRLGFGLSGISFALLSHCHKDHSKAAKDILAAGIDVYASAGTLEGIGVSGHHRAHIIKSEEQFKAGPWAVMPFEAQHDCIEPLSFLMMNADGEKFLFATDTFYVKFRFKGLSVIAVECNYSNDILQENVAKGLVPKPLKNRILKSHFSLDNVKEFFLANDLSAVREIHLLHLSESNSDPDYFQSEIQRLTGKPVKIAGKGGL